MSLFDPTFIKFDGSPDVGRIPTAVSVVDGQELTRAQQFGVDQAYGLFRAARRVSIAPFHAEGYVLPDGTKVHIWSLQNRDEVVIEPAPSTSEATELPHGFAVATNWQATLIYRRDLNDGIHWLLGPTAPQIQGVTTVNYDNQAFRKDVEADEFFNLPHVRDHWDTVLWDYKMNGAPTISETPVVPFLLKNSTTGVYALESPHYASGGKLIDAKGDVLYTMADEAPILVPDHPDYPEPVHQWPGATDAAGNQVALQAMRFTVISPTFNIWKFRFWNERINRTGDSTYALVERAATEFTTPWPKQTVTTVSINDNSLGEDPALLFKFKSTFHQNAGGVDGWVNDLSIPGTYRTFSTGWSGPDGWIDITGVPLNGQDDQSLREIREQTAGLLTYGKLIAAPTATEVGYIPIELRLNYPATVFWRGGHHQKWWYLENLNTFFGRPVYSSFGANYRVNDVSISRFDTKYDVDGSPTITAKLGWKDLHLLEGTTTGRMSGKEYTNQLGQNGNYEHIDGGWPDWRATKGTVVIDDFFDPVLWSSAPGFVAWLDANDVRGEYWADYMAYGTHPGYTQTTAPQPAVKYEYPFNIRPSNTVSYDLKSRYVIDFDQKGRFYAAIRCEVTATGAAWKENLAVYKGFMIKDTDPSYTVKIWFECEWDGVFAQQLLAEETITRPMFEAITVSQFSPWYWPFPAYIDRDCKVRTPPEPVPDENFVMMFANLASHQGVNTNLCCADVRPDITGADATKAISTDGVEYSYEEDGVVTPHTKFVTGQLYARTFKLSDFYEALWMLRQLKVNATQDNIAEDGGPGGTPRPEWYYHPVIKAALEVDRHIEVRDGVIVQWSDNIPTDPTGFPPEPPPLPAPKDRQIKLYRV